MDFHYTGPQLPSVAEIKAAHPNFSLEIPKFTGKLDDYQHVAVGCMHVGKRFLLGDHVGLGKTVELLGLIAYQWGLGKPPRWFITVERAQLYQWHSSIKQFLGIEAYIITGEDTKSKRLKYYKQLAKEESFIALIGYGSLKTDFDEISAIEGRSMAFDEAAILCNVNQTAVAAGRLLVNADYGIAITAEPITRGDVIQIWNLFNVLGIPLLSGSEFEEKFVIRETEKVWVKRYGKAKEIEVSKVVGGKNFDQLRELMAPHTIRRSDKILNRGGFLINKQLRTAEMTSTQAQLYEDLRKRKQTPGMDALEKQAVVEHVIQCLVSPWVVDQALTKDSPKIDLALNILEYEIPGEQAVIFCKHINTARLVEEKLTKQGITSLTVTGSVDPKERFELVQKFARGEARVFIMTFAAKQGVDGLQTNCRDLIILDQAWSPHTIVQVVGRLARRGQKHKVINVYFSALEDTFEKEIFEKLKARQSVADQVFEEEKSVLFSTDEVDSILSIM